MSYISDMMYEQGYHDGYQKALSELNGKKFEKVTRCKDCKWYGRVDKRRFYRGMDCLQRHIDTIVPDRDFCSKAERRGEQDAENKIFFG